MMVRVSEYRALQFDILIRALETTKVPGFRNENSMGYHHNSLAGKTGKIGGRTGNRDAITRNGSSVLDPGCIRPTHALHPRPLN
jgi:hypothetical protein